MGNKFRRTPLNREPRIGELSIETLIALVNAQEERRVLQLKKNRSDPLI